MDAFAFAREGIRPPPVAHRLPVGAVFGVPVVDRRLPERLEQVAPRLARDRPHRDRRIGRAERGGADLRYLGAQLSRQDRQAVDVRQLALVGRHAQRGIALGVLDALEPLARGQFHVRHLDVVLIVQPGLGLQLVWRVRGHVPDRRDRLPGLGGRGRHGAAGRRVPDRFGGGSAGLEGILEHFGRRHSTAGDAGGADEGQAVGAGRRARGIGAEERLGLVPVQLAAAMRPEMHDRGPAARHRDAICLDLFDGFARS